MGSEERNGEDYRGENDIIYFKYVSVRPENGGVVDLFRLLVASNDVVSKFVETSKDDDGFGPIPGDHRWVIIVSIIVRKLIGVFGKPMEWTGHLVEFVLNLLSENGELPGLIYNVLTGKVVMPQRGSDSFVSAIGHLDSRVDLYDNNVMNRLRNDMSTSRESAIEIGDRTLMDFCLMSSKLVYENPKVIKNIVTHHWKMHFVDFFNGWNDFQKERSTQVFILSDKPRDANVILISFRGTEPFDANDWNTDFDYSWYEIPKLGKVHMGFLEALGLGNRTQAPTFQENLQLGGYRQKMQQSKKEVNSQMVELSAYYAVRSRLKSLIDEHKNAKFLVTGHSLGGALAILFPTILVLHEEKEMMQRLLGVYTFGQPRVGDRNLGRVMESHLNHPSPKYFRVVYCNDLVPRLPYDNKTFLFKHFGMCLYYSSNYTEQRVEEEPNRNYFGMMYLIPEYLNAVRELLRSLSMGYAYGQDYKEGWFSILLRLIGLALPGISAHSPTNYINSVRLGREQIQIPSI